MFLLANEVFSELDIATDPIKVVRDRILRSEEQSKEEGDATANDV
jgi:hypothetical protein